MRTARRSWRSARLTSVRFQVLVPPPDVLTAFVAQVDPLHRRVVGNLEQSRTLTSLRDTLLPKLISGEVRITDADRIINHAV